MKVRIFGAALLLLSTLSLSPIVDAQNAAVPITFRVSGQVTNSTTFNLAKLEKMPVTTQNVTYFAAGGARWLRQVIAPGDKMGGRLVC